MNAKWVQLRHRDDACYVLEYCNGAMFELFDPQQEFTVRAGKLPHWFQPGVTYFVTFRTDDSVPQSLLRSWHGRRDDWLQRHNINPREVDWKAKLRQSHELELEYHRQFTRRFMTYLDRGYGACELRDPLLAELVAKALGHFDGDRYQLGNFVIMPNHVHLLVCLLDDTEIESQCRSWKTYSARRINSQLGRSGRFWQEESFDHLVRSPEQFEYFEQYIAKNPDKARLRAGEYLHRVRPK
jgi:REP element-mobilizing transposase RayT